MQYHVSRNGQMYGPYTLEDLRKYVTSGHILSTDLAKSDEMPEWQPVSQILGPSPAPPAYQPAPPYAGAAATTSYPDPPNLNWGLELLLGFFTCGLFVVVWNLVIAAWANRIQPASKALVYYIIATVLIVLNFGGSWGVFIAISHHEHPHQHVTTSFLSLACWVLRLIARFTLRDTLEQHFNGPEPMGLRLSAVMTFFFGGLYFQYKLNEICTMKQGMRYRTFAR
jgi:GYF domain 2